MLNAMESLAMAMHDTDDCQDLAKVSKNAAIQYLEDCSVPVASASTKEGVAATDAPAQ